MPIVSKLNYLRISPRKVRLVADLIRNNKVSRAERILNFTVKRAAEPLANLLKTAVADARNNFHLNSDNLYISKIIVNEGPKYKRWEPRSRGMANQIKKRTSHITLVLKEIKPEKEAKAAGGEEKPKKEIFSIKKAKEEKNIAVSKKQVSADILEKKEEVRQPAEKIKQPPSSQISQSKTWEDRQRPGTELLKYKPKDRGVLKRIFRRKSF